MICSIKTRPLIASWIQSISDLRIEITFVSYLTISFGDFSIPTTKWLFFIHDCEYGSTKDVNNQTMIALSWIHICDFSVSMIMTFYFYMIQYSNLYLYFSLEWIISFLLTASLDTVDLRSNSKLYRNNHGF